ncbi:MAG: outer membrane beta-barrel protein [Mucilaginibacter polytrichastri]|nr:outer membrane beta-barrel protein [Mucilaginibacter polytrichastri]
MRKFVVLFSLLFFAYRADAQSWELGGGIGSSGYMGDLNQANVFKYTDLAFGGFFKRNFNGYLSAKLSFWHGQLRADDARSSNEDFRLRNINFISPLNELALTGEWNILSYQADAGKNRWTPYLFAGVGFISFDPRTRIEDKTIRLQPLETEGESYKRVSMSIPFGTGIKYNIKGHWNLGGEIGYRTAMTDYLDDVSGNYPDPQKLVNVNDRVYNVSDPSNSGSGGRGLSGTQRGDLRKRDTYMFVGISVSYTFVTQKCYDF